MALYLNRRCWQCSGKLMAVSHAEVEVDTPTGKHTLHVHKVCEAATRGHFRKITAQPSDAAPRVGYYEPAAFLRD